MHVSLKSKNVLRSERNVTKAEPLLFNIVMRELLFGDDGLYSWNAAFETHARTLKTSV